ncbi:hypothetical protein ACQQ93_10480 [Lachnospiraceae bacterium SGI.256]
MTEKELRRLSRRELLEMLIAQMEENEHLKRELEETQSKLQSKHIVIQNAGSIAEASLQINGVFESAQAAAEQYLENIKQMSEQQDKIKKKIQEDAQKQADAIIAEADAYREKAHTEADIYWKQVSDKIQNLLQEYENLRILFQSGRSST